MKTKLMIASLMIALMSVVVGITSAQEQQPGNQPGDGPAVQRPDRPNGGPRGDGEGSRSRGNGLRGDGGVVDTVIEQTGLTMQELREQLQGDATLADVIAANDGDVQAVIDATLAPIGERLDEAVANGTMTQEEADEALANAEARVTEAVNNGALSPEDRQGIRQNRRGNQLSGIINETLETAGITVEDLQAAREAGLTLPEILAENGIDAEIFAADALASLQAQLAEAVANGNLTQEQADDMYARFEELLNNNLNGEEAGQVTVPNA
jgi:hypothetical protein